MRFIPSRAGLLVLSVVTMIGCSPGHDISGGVTHHNRLVLDTHAATIQVGAIVNVTCTVAADLPADQNLDYGLDWKFNDVGTSVVNKISNTPNVTGNATTGVFSGLTPGQSSIDCLAKKHVDYFPGFNGNDPGDPFIVKVVAVAPPQPASIKADTLVSMKITDAAFQLAPLVKDASGNVISNPLLIFSSTNPSIAKVSTTGAVTAVSPGITNLTITASAASGNTITSSSASDVTASVQVVVKAGGSCASAGSGVGAGATVTVASDPGNNAATIGMHATQQLSVSFLDPKQSARQMAIYINGDAPMVNVNGDFTDNACTFAANGTGTIGGKSNVGVRATGVWATSNRTVTYTVGTNNEFTGGPIVYTLKF